MPYKDPGVALAHGKSYRDSHKKEKAARRRVYYMNNKEKVKAQVNKWAVNHREQRKGSNLRRLYELTLEAFKALLLAQGEKCASCGTEDWGPCGPCVDHDHTSGKVRGIVCHDCNMSEGLLKDPARAQALANYMKRHQE